jgi:hypothetical protein
MKPAAVLSLLIGAVAAFAPQKQVSRASMSLSAFENELGVQKPLGFWYVFLFIKIDLFRLPTRGSGILTKCLNVPFSGIL